MLIHESVVSQVVYSAFQSSPLYKFQQRSFDLSYESFHKDLSRIGVGFRDKWLYCETII